MIEELIPIIVRPLKLRDLDEIMEIEPVAYGPHHWSRQSFVNELTNPNGSYFGAESLVEGKLLGYSGYWLVGDEAHITTLAVAPFWRRQRIGERLLVNNVVESRRAGANWLTLEVRVSNEAAQKLYFKYGFRNLGVRRRYYQDNSEDALVLWTDRITDPEFVESFVEKVFELELNGDAVKEALLLSDEPELSGACLDEICFNEAVSA
ncbi:MAG: ribosomal protein S18-alanine N-acetyltransferase [Candidatus Obscuribacterales bacterium]|nr:ribosomal protein S18-alanine N-acetyltransferase [Candidatus Obscuribacterales bacterium]